MFRLGLQASQIGCSPSR